MAGIGASGAMMASAVVLFVILIGIVTFKTWPHAGSLVSIGGGGDVALQDTAAPPPRQSSQGGSTVNLSKLLGGGQAAQRQTIGHGGRAGIVNGPVTGGGGGLPGGSGGSSPGQSLGAQPPSSPPARPSPDIVGQTVSGVGDTVQHTTENVGGTVNTATGTNLGNVVSGLGSASIRTSRRSPASTSGGQPLASPARPSAAPHPAARRRAERWCGRHPAR